ncbi:MAG: crossover junction endodeoxyribonuclease RuvC [Patescibacteria group bacterium]|jgi:crossover junction endodeoxyribonuclease RuvC
METMNKIILGLDPGTATTGFGVVKDTKGQVEYVDCGCIITTLKSISPARKATLSVAGEPARNAPVTTSQMLAGAGGPAERLLTIQKSLEILIKKYQPDILAVEKLFFTKNITTAISVAEARGVILVTAAKHNLEIAEYTPLQVKQTLTGYGKADKQQIQRMVKSILKLQSIPKPDDAADALAIAICAVHHTVKVGC